MLSIQIYFKSRVNCIKHKIRITNSDILNCVFHSTTVPTASAILVKRTGVKQMEQSVKFRQNHEFSYSI